MLMECKISDSGVIKAQNVQHSDAGYATRQAAAASPIVETEMGSKKRKRDENDKSDPKLREFLQVMKAGREAPIADVPMVTDEGAASSGMPEVVVPEEESDEEYEQIPTRKEKQRRIDPPEKKAHSTTEQTVRLNGPIEILEPAAQATADSTESKSIDQSRAAPDATDDDWLRSRTNRLLDLVDPDDLPTSAIPGSAGNPDETRAETDGNDGEIAHTSEQSPEDVAMEHVSQEPKGDDAVEAIRRTSRLFVRNLPYGATEDDLREFFERFGTIQEVRGLQILTVSFGNVMNPDRDSLYFGI